MCMSLAPTNGQLFKVQDMSYLILYPLFYLVDSPPYHQAVIG